MRTVAKLPPLFAVALGASLMAMPAIADDAAPTGPPVVLAAESDAPDEAEEEESGRPALAQTPQDRFGLLLLGALGAAGVAGWKGMRRQLSGDRPSASGEFRWR